MQPPKDVYTHIGAGERTLPVSLNPLFSLDLLTCIIFLDLFVDQHKCEDNQKHNDHYDNANHHSTDDDSCSSVHKSGLSWRDNAQGYYSHACIKLCMDRYKDRVMLRLTEWLC